MATLNKTNATVTANKEHLVALAKDIILTADMIDLDSLETSGTDSDVPSESTTLTLNEVSDVPTEQATEQATANEPEPGKTTIDWYSIPAIRDYAAYLLAEAVTRIIGDKAGSKHKLLTEYTTLLGFTPGRKRTVVSNDAVSAAKQAVSEAEKAYLAAESPITAYNADISTAVVAGDMDTAIRLGGELKAAREAANLPALQDAIKVAKSVLASANRVSRTAGSLRALELNCIDSAHSQGFDAASIKKMGAAYTNAAIESLRNIETDSDVLNAAIGHVTTYDVLKKEQFQPVAEIGKQAYELAKHATACKQVLSKAESSVATAIKLQAETVGNPKASQADVDRVNGQVTAGHGFVAKCKAELESAEHAAKESKEAATAEYKKAFPAD